MHCIHQPKIHFPQQKIQRIQEFVKFVFSPWTLFNEDTIWAEDVYLLSSMKRNCYLKILVKLEL